MEWEKALQLSDFDLFAGEFERTRKKPWKEATDFLDSLPEGSRILDIGAGGGRHAIYAAKKHQAVALDISRKMVKIAREKEKNLLCVAADATHLPFCSSSFGAITYVASIHHIRDDAGRREALKEIKRVLAPGGKLIASAWALDQKKLGALADEKGDIEHTWDKKHARFYHLFRENELFGLAREEGFRNVREWREGNNWWVAGEK